MSNPSKKSEARRLLDFALVGSANSVACYALYVALVALGWHFNLALVANYVFGIVLGYFLHCKATFSDRSRRPRAFARYAIALWAGFAINLLVLNLIVGSGWNSPLAAQIVAMTVATAAGYPMQSEWVFQDHETKPTPSHVVANAAVRGEPGDRSGQSVEDQRYSPAPTVAGETFRATWTDDKPARQRRAA